MPGLCAQELAQEEMMREAAARARRVLEQHDCQLDLPEVEEVGGRSSRSGAGGQRAPLRRADRSSTDLGSGDLGVSIAQPLMWGVLTLAVLALLAAIVRGLGGRVASTGARKGSLPTAVAFASAPGPGSLSALPDHARLAAAGEFAAAIRALLQQALAVLVERTGPLPDSATGRGAVTVARDQSLAIGDLTALVAAVELVHFGGRPASSDLYAASVANLQRWGQACRQAK